MNKKYKNNKEVYSITGFSDLVASPFFYSILIITVILGLASTFGFFQNPKKLKRIIDIISHRVFISEVRPFNMSKVVNNRAYSIEEEKLTIIYRRDGNITASSLNRDRYSIFSEQFSLKEAGFNPVNRMVAIDYDISSSQFLGALNFKQLQADLVSTPISPYYSLEKDRLRYSLGVNNRIL